MTTPQPQFTLSDNEWRRRLSAQEFNVLRRGHTEEPFTGEYTDTKTAGTYFCRACGAEIFRSTDKFNPETGFASFFDAAHRNAVILRPDNTADKIRSEVLCANCLSHLGHLFIGEGYPTPIDQRYCINSMSLQLAPTA